MNEERQSAVSVSSGLGMAPSTMLTLVFVGAKLGGYVNWSWWVVFAPTLMPLGLGVSLLALAGLAWAAFIGLGAFRD